MADEIIEEIPENDVEETIEASEEYTFADYFTEAADFLRTLSSLVYRELTSQQIEDLAAYDFIAMRNDLDMEPGDLSDGFTGIGRYLNRRGVNVRQDLAVEYARIFLAAGSYDGKTAVPYESVYTSPQGLLMQESRDEVVKIYAKQGLRLDPDIHEPEDHLGFELEFLAHMCDRTIAALDEEDADVDGLVQVQIDFIDEHILNWIGDLNDRVQNYATSIFYTSVMKIIIGYVNEHRATLADMLEEE